MKPVFSTKRSTSVIAKANPSPPDVPKTRRGGREWLSSLFSKFGPMQDRAKNVTVLDFEKPLVELDNRINEVSSCASCEEQSSNMEELYWFPRSLGLLSFLYLVK